MLSTHRYRIITIGKVKKLWLKEGIESYQKRLPGLSITSIKDSNSSKEYQQIINLIKKDDYLISLTEEGIKMDSIRFSNHLKSLGSKKIVFILGGPSGLPQSIKNDSFDCLSLSSMTFPHEIAQLLLIEQIYRSLTISQDLSYHRE
tara:strand:+ start:1941 stop:2378 length:438 start_codon:yes stop_codon:yes gene_type:complete